MPLDQAFVEDFAEKEPFDWDGPDENEEHVEDGGRGEGRSWGHKTLALWSSDSPHPRNLAERCNQLGALGFPDTCFLSPADCDLISLGLGLKFYIF